MGPQLVDYLLYEKEDNGILWVKFNRPEKMNASMGRRRTTGRSRKSANICGPLTMILTFVSLF